MRFFFYFLGVVLHVRRACCICLHALCLENFSRMTRCSFFCFLGWWCCMYVVHVCMLPCLTCPDNFPAYRAFGLLRQDRFVLQTAEYASWAASLCWVLVLLSWPQRCHGTTEVRFCFVALKKKASKLHFCFSLAQPSRPIFFIIFSPRTVAALPRPPLTLDPTQLQLQPHPRPHPRK